MLDAQFPSIFIFIYTGRQEDNIIIKSVLFCPVFKNRRGFFARCAPCGPKIDDDIFAFEFIEIYCFSFFMLRLKYWKRLPFLLIINDSHLSVDMVSVSGIHELAGLFFV